MSYKVVISDGTGQIVFEAKIDALSLLDAGIKAEDIYDEFHLEHPCKRCKHKCRVISNEKGLK